MCGICEELQPAYADAGEEVATQCVARCWTYETAVALDRSPNGNGSGPDWSGQCVSSCVLELTPFPAGSAASPFQTLILLLASCDFQTIAISFSESFSCPCPSSLDFRILGQNYQ